DDVVFSPNLRSYLEESLWPAPRTGVVSVYCPSHHGRNGEPGFHVQRNGWDTWGALAYVFPNASLRAFLAHPAVVNHRQRGPAYGSRNIDSVVGQWCELSKLPYFVHVPSLAQH